MPSAPGRAVAATTVSSHSALHRVRRLRRSSAVSRVSIAASSSSSLFCCAGDGSEQHRRGVAAPAVEAELGHVVEEGEELVELLVGDRIELVRVAARAPHRQAHERGGGRLDAIDDVLDLILVGNRPTLEVDHVVAIEARRHLLIARRVRQQVAGELLDRELIERQVAVERVDDPVAPRPHAAVAVDVVAVRVGVAGGVEPRHRHALAVARRLQQRVDAPSRRRRASGRRGTRRPRRASAAGRSGRR